MTRDPATDELPLFHRREQEEVFRPVIAFIEATVQGAVKIAQPGDALQDEVGGTFPDH